MKLGGNKCQGLKTFILVLNKLYFVGKKIGY